TDSWLVELRVPLSTQLDLTSDAIAARMRPITIRGDPEGAGALPACKPRARSRDMATEVREREPNRDAVLNGSPSEADVLESFGYEQKLDRAMGPFSSFAVSFSGMSITTAVFLTIGFVVVHSGTAGIWSWVISSVAVLLIASVFADL